MRNKYSISCLALVVAMSLGPVAAFAQTTQGATSNQTNTNQAQKQSTANTEAGACDRLIERLRGMPIDQRPIRLRQARQYRQNNNTRLANSHCSKWISAPSPATVREKQPADRLLCRGQLRASPSAGANPR